MNRLVKAMLTIWLAMTATTAIAEDIDLFASGLASGGAASSLPNVIFVLDNTSNWSRQSQKWPDGAIAVRRATSRRFIVTFPAFIT